MCAHVSSKKYRFFYIHNNFHILLPFLPPPCYQLLFITNTLTSKLFYNKHIGQLWNNRWQYTTYTNSHTKKISLWCFCLLGSRKLYLLRITTILMHCLIIFGGGGGFRFYFFYYKFAITHTKYTKYWAQMDSITLVLCSTFSLSKRVYCDWADCWPINHKPGLSRPNQKIESQNDGTKWTDHINYTTRYTRFRTIENRIEF